MASIRDIMCAQSVGEMSKLGRFDQEFIMYGCAYENQGQLHYMISSIEATIYDFIENSVKQGLYPTPVMTLTKTCSVPAGAEEDIALSVKVELAKQLKEAYPKAFFDLLQDFAEIPANDRAVTILNPIQEQLEGQFVEEKLQLFEGLVHLAYEGKVISPKTYQQYQNWLKDVRSQMTDDVVIKEIFERTFYGIAYTKEDGRLAYFFNGQKENTYRKKEQLAAEGATVSPILEKTCWFDYSLTIKDVRSSFEQYLATMYDQGYMALVKAIKQLPAAIDAEPFKARLDDIQKHYSPEALYCFEKYGKRWNVL